jgi:benzoate-CoA ligase family protein
MPDANSHTTSDSPEGPTYVPPETFNIADYFLDERVREGRGNRRAILTDAGSLTYADVQTLANLYGNLLLDAGVQPEQRVLIALTDGAEFVAALFGALKIGAVAVLLNPHAKPEEIEYFFRYTRGVVLFVGSEMADGFRRVADGIANSTQPGGGVFAPRHIFVADTLDFQEKLASLSPELENFPTHRDDAAIWLFSGGTTGRPKAVMQTHTAFANTTECYAKRVIGYHEDDVTLSVPKLFFGYAAGSNLLFPFAVGATAALFPDRCTTEALFDKIERFQPTVLVNVPTMVNQMLAHPRAGDMDVSSLRLATSAGEPLPAELHRRWDETFLIDLLDGLGTAEMWHIFISNRLGDVKAGTLGKIVPGFEVRVCDDDGCELPHGEVGWLWVRGNSRALGYWQQMEKTREAFRGEWYVSGDMIARDAEGYFTYCGRGDDMLKVKGRWLSPKEVESCLLHHPKVQECAVVGVADPDGLMSAHAFVVCHEEALATELHEFVKGRLASYKCPRTITVMDDFPRTHLGKVDRGALRASAVQA